MARNHIEYPITTDEIIDVLLNYLDQETAKLQDPDAPIGNDTALVLTEAIRRLREQHNNWCVTRVDDNGNQFMVRDGISEKDARALHALLESRGHKQVYRVWQG